MYRRTPRSAVYAALGAVLAAVVLSGCASRSAQPNATLGGGTPVTQAAQPSTAPPVAATFGSDYAVQVELTATGTPTQVTILNQAKALILAYEKAVEADDPKDPTYQNLVIGNAQSALYQSVSTYKSASQRPTGTDVFYQFDASVTPGLGADVEFCEDQSKVHLVNSATGAPVAGGTKNQHWDFGYNANSNGSWTIAYVSARAVTAGSTQCT